MNSRNESPLVILTRALPPAVVGAMVAQVALVIGGLMIGALLLGMALDVRFGTRPTLTLALAFISLPLSLWLTYRIALRTSARARSAYLASQKHDADEPAQGDQAGAMSAALKVDR
jgi:hypothetical protein